MRHSQVVLFVHSLMFHPSALVHHVYECWIEGGKQSAGKTLIEAIFHEAALPVPKKLLHNQLINYCSNNDTAPVHVPSRFHLFHKMKARISCNIDHGDTLIPTCVMMITYPDEEITKTLLPVCKKICEHQTICQLHLRKVHCEDLKESEVFNLSKSAQSVTIDHCKLPSPTLNHLIQQMNGCTTLHNINLRCTNLKTVSLLTFSNKKLLTHLDLESTYMCAKLSAAVCQELSKLVHLKHLNLSGDDLSEVSCLSLNNKKNISHLDLGGYTCMPAELAVDLCLQLSELVHLDHLNLSRNDLSEVSSLNLSNKRSLKYLYLYRTRMSADLCRSICQQLNNLLHIQLIDVSDNTFTGCLTSVERDTKTGGLSELRELNLSYTK